MLDKTQSKIHIHIYRVLHFYDFHFRPNFGAYIFGHFHSWQDALRILHYSFPQKLSSASLSNGITDLFVFYLDRLLNAWLFVSDRLRLLSWTKELAETIKFEKFLKTNKFEVFEINWEQIAKGRNERTHVKSPKGREQGKETVYTRWESFKLSPPFPQYFPHRFSTFSESGCAYVCPSYLCENPVSNWKVFKTNMQRKRCSSLRLQRLLTAIASNGQQESEKEKQPKPSSSTSTLGAEKNSFVC